MRLVVILLSWILMTFAAPASAGDAVSLSVTANDSVGQTLIYNMRQKISASFIFHNAENGEYPRWNVYVVTLDPDKDSKYSQTRTIYSLILALESKESPPWYINNWVGKCGSDVTSTCAEQLVAAISDEIEKLKKSKP